MAGKLSFYGAGGAARISGKISVTSGGLVALLGGAVSESGAISAPLGRIGLGAGSAVTLDLTGASNPHRLVAGPTPNTNASSGQVGVPHPLFGASTDGRATLAYRRPTNSGRMGCQNRI